MREITDHKAPGMNDALSLYATDKPGAGGANQRYLIMAAQDGVTTTARIQFQEGSPREAGINGISNEVLLAIVIDRLRSFQAGPFPSRDNAAALPHLNKALHRLQRRSRQQIANGGEG